MKSMIIILILTFVGGVAYFADTSEHRTTMDSCVPVSQSDMAQAVLLASSKTGVPAEWLAALLLVESSYGRNTGVPGALVHHARLSRDGIPAIAIADLLGYNPYTVCASQANGHFGGAMGVGQILPSTWLSLGGIRIRGFYSEVSSEGRVRDNFFHKKTSSRFDVLLLQYILAVFLKGYTEVSPSGVFDAETADSMVRFNKGYTPQMSGLCMTAAHQRQFGSCTKMNILVHTRVQNPRDKFFEWNYVYDSAQDRVAQALGIQGPSDPWVPSHSVMGVALYLLDLGILQDPRKAISSYYAGSSNWQNGVGYYQKVVAKVPQARALL